MDEKKKMIWQYKATLVQSATASTPISVKIYPPNGAWMKLTSARIRAVGVAAGRATSLTLIEGSGDTLATIGSASLTAGQSLYLPNLKVIDSDTATTAECIGTSNLEEWVAYPDYFLISLTGYVEAESALYILRYEVVGDNLGELPAITYTNITAGDVTVTYNRFR